MDHHCHAYGCCVPCPPESLMCPRHWAMVPTPLQNKVWRHYRPGQCDDKRPSSEWFAAADRAIRHVREREEAMFARDPQTNRVPLHALSVRQPWADLIAAGVKDVENREWNPPPAAKGHLIAIHVGKTLDRESWSVAYQIVAKLGALDVCPRIKAFGAALLEAQALKPRAAQAAVKRAMEAASAYGAIIALARIDAVTSEATSPWFMGPIGWRLGSVVAIEPVACGGAQYLWPVRDPVLRLVRKRYADAIRRGNAEIASPAT